MWTDGELTNLSRRSAIWRLGSKRLNCSLHCSTTCILLVFKSFIKNRFATKSKEFNWDLFRFTWPTTAQTAFWSSQPFLAAFIQAKQNVSKNLVYCTMRRKFELSGEKWQDRCMLDESRLKSGSLSFVKVMSQTNSGSQEAAFWAMAMEQSDRQTDRQTDRSLD